MLVRKTQWLAGAALALALLYGLAFGGAPSSAVYVKDATPTPAAPNSVNPGSGSGGGGG